LIDASSIIELRTHPARLEARIDDFIDDCWSAEAVGPAKRAAGA
jgi:hypothetical protein